MTSDVTKNTAWDEMPPVITWQNVLVMLMAVVMGAFTAIVVLPSWLPALTASLSGESPKV